MTQWERSMRDIQAAYRAGNGLPPLSDDVGFTVPVSVREVDVSLAGWPTRRERDAPEPPEPTLAERLIGRKICSDTRRYDERELRRAYNHIDKEK